MRSSGGREDWDGIGVDVREVLARLAAQRCPADGGVPFTLAGVLNLVAYAPDPAEIGAMAEVIERLADHQPSRAVLLAGVAGGEGIDATVSTSCRLGGETGVAVEVVVLTLHGDAAGEGAASATVPLLRPDLPTVLWWPGPPDAGGDGALDRLTAVADRVVTEAGRAPGRAAVRALADWAGPCGAAVTDLAWARITPWRQLVAQVLDGRPITADDRARTAITVAHAGTEPGVGALLLAGWLTDVLPGGPAVRLTPRAGADGDGDGDLLAVDLDGGDGGRRLTVERLPGRAAAAVRVTGADGSTQRRTLPLPATDRAELLAGELEMQRRDRPFERALAGAATVAG